MTISSIVSYYTSHFSRVQNITRLLPPTHTHFDGGPEGVSNIIRRPPFFGGEYRTKLSCRMISKKVVKNFHFMREKWTKFG